MTFESLTGERLSACFCLGCCLILLEKLRDLIYYGVNVDMRGGPVGFICMLTVSGTGGVFLGYSAESVCLSFRVAGHGWAWYGVG